MHSCVRRKGASVSCLRCLGTSVPGRKTPTSMHSGAYVLRMRRRELLGVSSAGKLLSVSGERKGYR